MRLLPKLTLGILVAATVPLAIAGRIEYFPALPAARNQIHQRSAMGSTVKILAAYRRPFWRERGFSGEAVATSGDISAVFDNTTHDGSVPCLLAFVVGMELAIIETNHYHWPVVKRVHIRVRRRLNSSLSASEGNSRIE